MIGKKGYSTGFTWIFGLVSLFGLGLLYIVFGQVFDAHLVPTIKDMTSPDSFIGDIDAETSATIHSNIDRYMLFFNSLPFILFGLVIFYMFLAAWRKEGDGQLYG